MNERPNDHPGDAALDAWARVDRILDRWLDETDGTGAEWPPSPERLEELCGGDDGLRREVAELARLLGSRGTGGTDGDLLDRPVGDGLPDLVESLGVEIEQAPYFGAIGRVIDRYRLVEVLGTGGMGVVYEAERADRDFEQRVALKLLPLGLETPEKERRFLNERRILARLEHPGIARLIDGGLAEDGLPYLVMELVRGEPIDRHCASRSLGERDRVGLLVQVCAAVHYAHQNLVLHRDLKPSNIMVAHDGGVKLLDFGIGKMLDETSDEPPTRIQPMTPEYAAPEQLRNGSVSTATDVYALGVLAATLLAQGPRSAGGRGTVRRPERPSRELRSIVDRAREESPADRFASAAEMAEDLRSYLDGRPVRSWSGSLWYRLSKTVRRHRAAAAAFVVAMLSLLAAAIFSAHQARLAAFERDQARLEVRRTQHVAEVLAGLFENASPYSGGSDRLTVSELLDRGESRVRTELSGEPGVRAPVLSALGVARSALGEADRAGELLGAAVDDLRRMDPPDELALVEALRQWARVELDLGKSETAGALLSEAASLLRSRGVEDSPAVARIERQRGRLETAAGRHDSAAERHSLALGILESAGLGTEAALEKTYLATSLEEMGLRDEGVRLEREAMTTLRSALGEDHPHVAALRGNIAVSLNQGGRYAEAEALFRETLESSERVLGSDHRVLATPLTNLGRVLMDLGRFREAEESLRRAVDLLGRDTGPDAFERIGAEINLATLESTGGDTESALGRYLGAAERLRRLTGPSSGASARVACLLGIALHRHGDLDGAERQLRNALAVQQSMSSLRLADTYAGLGAVLADRGRPEEAERHLRAALDLRKQAPGEAGWKGLELRVELARVLLLGDSLPAAVAEASELLKDPRLSRVETGDDDWLASRLRAAQRSLIRKERRLVVGGT